MSQIYEIRKIHTEGAERISKGITIPQKFLKECNIHDGSYIKVYMSGKGEKIICLQKLE